MTQRFPVIAAAAFACAALSAPAAMAAEKQSGEDELAELLEGREAGEPTSCISDFRTGRNLRVIDGTALVYGRGKTIYVNRTRNPKRLDDDDVLVSRRYGSQICRQDIITRVDRGSGFYNGNVFLAEFVPYTRVDKEEEQAAES
ncbi:hypothetical protein [Altererythrobacter lutimaris]|uniref:Secreted protein n=1 Tax=Altererythrobacter lutimaris TaxID=2743979 RepID=A0A850HE92_9SPHN|nr:hypothetical protein [Altererythrobacter lutimaris]NVE95158.1 hypothetical protein [Altererythrobacter lutimaris]